MPQLIRLIVRSLVSMLCVGLGLSACRDTRPSTGNRTAAATDSSLTSADTAPPKPAAPDTADIRFEVDLAARVVRVLGAGIDTLAVHPVAIGSTEWPTQSGSWAINQVVLNPEWIPPDETWAEEREPRKPGDPKNPLGRAQLVYDMPRTIHGTNDSTSVGKAVSHGSLRVTNAVALWLATLVLERASTTNATTLVQRAAADRSEKQIITLTRVVPIRVF
ncbi:L,D-transpeptidase [Gemmatimonas sp.]|uniref:L,D-transpeptidase n=2 Tax=Gemmatimonas sp. TaxID=1962908 RepID=UPI0035699496